MNETNITALRGMMSVDMGRSQIIGDISRTTSVFYYRDNLQGKGSPITESEYLLVVDIIDRRIHERHTESGNQSLCTA